MATQARALVIVRTSQLRRGTFSDTKHGKARRWKDIFRIFSCKLSEEVEECEEPTIDDEKAQLGNKGDEEAQSGHSVKPCRNNDKKTVSVLSELKSPKLAKNQVAHVVQRQKGDRSKLSTVVAYLVEMFAENNCETREEHEGELSKTRQTVYGLHGSLHCEEETARSSNARAENVDQHASLQVARLTSVLTIVESEAEPERTRSENW